MAAAPVRRVFLSYTSELAQYPKDGTSWVAAVKEAVELAGDMPVEMRQFTAADQPPAELCRRKVTESDVYVGIVGFRYGTPVPDDPDRSYVELEFDAATAAGIPRLMFLVDKETSMPMDFFVDRAFGRRQEEFRARLDESELIRVLATSPEKLQTLVLQALNALPRQSILVTATRPESDRGPVVSVPPLPAGTIDRTGLTQRLVRLLTRQDTGAGEASVVGIATALRGAGGFGKTRLATMICHDAEILDYFRDGIIWVTMGEQVTGADLAGKVNGVCLLLTRKTLPLTDPIAAGAELGKALDGRQMLLVIDDVWSRVQLEPFLNGGSDVTRLVTTRQQGALPMGTVAVDVDAMNDQEARQMLTADLGPVPHGPVDRVLAATGRWPVLLSLVHGAARADRDRGSSVADSLTGTLQRLLARGPAALDVTNPDQREAAVGTTMAASLNRLDPEQIDRYMDLAVFPEDTYIPRAVLEPYWAAASGWDSFQVHDFCGQLADLSLVQEYRLDRWPRLRLHDVIRSYLVHRAGSDLRRRHAALIDVHRGLAQISDTKLATTGVRSEPPTLAGAGVRTDWSQLPDKERYLWSFTGYHLHYADLDDELAACLHSARYLAGRLDRVGPGVLETELGYLDDPVSVELLTAIQQSAHLLAPLEPPGSLTATLASRLADARGLTSIAADLQNLLPYGHLQAYAPLPDTPSPALKRVLTGHTSYVRTLAAAPDGSWLASAGDDGTVRIWNPATATATHTLPGHTRGVRALAAAPDGSWLASAGDDGTVRIWNPATATATHTLPGHTRGVRALAAAPDGSWLASASDDGTVRIWNPATATATHTLPGHTRGVRALAAAPDGSWLASASDDGKVRIWNPATGAATHTLSGHTRGVRALAAVADGSWLASAGDDRTVRIWNPATGAATQTLSGHTRGVQALAAAPDGSWLASAGDDGTVRIWSPNRGTAIATATHTLTEHTDCIRALAAAPDGSWLASAGDDGTVRIWNPATGTATQTLSGHTRGVQALAAAPDGSWLASAGDDRTVRIWNPAAATPIHAGHPFRVRTLAVAPDGSWLASAGDDRTVRIWDPATATAIRTFTGHTNRVSALTAAADGSWLASAGDDGTVRIWNPATGTATHTLSGHTLEVRALAAPSDGSWLASAGDDRTVRIWNPATATATHTLPGHTRGVRALAAPSDGSWLASAGDDGTVRIWNPATATATHTLPGHTRGVRALAAAPDGSWLASAGDDGTVRIWNPDRGTATHTLTGHTDCIHALAAAPDGAWLASAGDDGTVRIWNLFPTPATTAALRVDGALKSLTVFQSGALVAAGDHGPYWLRFSNVWPNPA